MKTVIIGGVCRTGKSRLANQVFQSTKSTVFHADTLTNMLKKNYPEAFKVEWKLDGNPTKDPSEKVLIKLIKHMGKEFNYTRIFETSILNPLTAHQAFNSKNFIILYMGYPSVEPRKKLENGVEEFTTMSASLIVIVGGRHGKPLLRGKSPQ